MGKSAVLLVVLACAVVTVHAQDDEDSGPEFASVTCGSAVKLQHHVTGYRVHSHDIKWGSGSQQQSVTSMNGQDDPNSLWVIKGAHGTHCPQGTPVKNGMAIRFTHLKTKKNLHTHAFPSPLTKQQEVSAYGNAGEGDSMDDWVLETEGQPNWQRGARVRMRHKGTGAYLHSHTVSVCYIPWGGNDELNGRALLLP